LELGPRNPGGKERERKELVGPQADAIGQTGIFTSCSYGRGEDKGSEAKTDSYGNKGQVVFIDPRRAFRTPAASMCR
jgi:hypothetical protein